jgi:hypothetical protein
MDKKLLGYVFTAVGFVNLLVINGVSNNILGFLTFLGLIVFGIILLSKEDTPVKTLFESIKNKNLTANTGNPATQLNIPQNVDGNKNLLNYLAYGAAALTAFSVFLPWIEASSSSNIGELSSNFNTEFSGISTGGGIFGLVLALVGIYLAYQNLKWAFVAGAINFIDGLAYTFGWLSNKTEFNSNADLGSEFGEYSIKSGTEPMIGLYLFTISSLLFVLFTLKNLKSSNQIPLGK